MLLKLNGTICQFAKIMRWHFSFVLAELLKGLLNGFLGNRNLKNVIESQMAMLSHSTMVHSSAFTEVRVLGFLNL